jgi:hypothetical protein
MTQTAQRDIKAPKIRIKRVKNAAKEQLSEMPEKTDRDRLHDMAILFLERLKMASNARAAYNEDGKIMETAAGKLYEKIFGKNSYVDTLMSLTNLLLKLEQPLAPDPAIDAGIADIELNPADVALLDDFVGRIRS